MGGEGEGVAGRGDGLGVPGRGDGEGVGGTLPLIRMSAQLRKISAGTGRRVQQSAGWLGKAAAPTMYCDAQQRQASRHIAQSSPTKAVLSS
jgi:hypothetical protein